MSQREDIMDALFAILAAIPQFKSASRRLDEWKNVNIKPALFLHDAHEIHERSIEGLPAKRTLQADIFIYTDSGADDNAIPATELNNLIDAVESALEPLPGFEAQTLGGLVQHCWIEGTMVKEAGDLDGFGIAIIPIKISVP